MKPREILLPVLLAAPALLFAEDAAPAKPRTSARLSQELRTLLPAYDSSQYVPPPAPDAVGSPGTDLPPTLGILKLPKVTVREGLARFLDPDQMISPEKLLQQQKRDYLASLEAKSELTRVLNSFHIPFVTPSVAARARAHYQNQKTVRLADTIDSIGKVDPEAAASLRKELFKDVDRPSLGKK